MGSLRVAVPNKGQLAEPARAMLIEAGYLHNAGLHDLVVHDPQNDVEFFFLVRGAEKEDDDEEGGKNQESPIANNSQRITACENNVQIFHVICFVVHGVGGGGGGR